MHSFTFERRKIIVTATLKGPNDRYDYQFILDTGAATSVIDENVAISLGYSLYNIPIQILVDGLIGMDFLRNFRKITFHFDRQTIEVE
jgi:predicted aspartyl protease